MSGVERKRILSCSLVIGSGQTKRQPQMCTARCATLKQWPQHCLLRLWRRLSCPPSCVPQPFLLSGTGQAAEIYTFKAATLLITH